MCLCSFSALLISVVSVPFMCVRAVHERVYKKSLLSSSLSFPLLCADESTNTLSWNPEKGCLQRRWVHSSHFHGMLFPCVFISLSRKYIYTHTHSRTQKDRLTPARNKTCANTHLHACTHILYTRHSTCNIKIFKLFPWHSTCFLMVI